MQKLVLVLGLFLMSSPLWAQGENEELARELKTISTFEGQALVDKMKETLLRYGAQQVVDQIGRIGVNELPDGTNFHQDMFLVRLICDGFHPVCPEILINTYENSSHKRQLAEMIGLFDRFSHCSLQKLIQLTRTDDYLFLQLSDLVVDPKRVEALCNHSNPDVAGMAFNQIWSLTADPVLYLRLKERLEENQRWVGWLHNLLFEIEIRSSDFLSLFLTDSQVEDYRSCYRTVTESYNRFHSRVTIAALGRAIRTDELIRKSPSLWSDALVNKLRDGLAKSPLNCDEIRKDARVLGSIIQALNSEEAEKVKQALVGHRELTQDVEAKRVFNNLIEVCDKTGATSSSNDANFNGQFLRPFLADGEMDAPLNIFMAPSSGDSKLPTMDWGKENGSPNWFQLPNRQNEVPIR